MAAQLITHVANSVLDHDTGKQLNYGQLRKHPKFQEKWKKYFSNAMGRLCPGIGTGVNGLGKIVEGKHTFYVIKFEDIPKDRLNGICYNSVVFHLVIDVVPQEMKRIVNPQRGKM